MGKKRRREIGDAVETKEAGVRSGKTAESGVEEVK